MKHMPARLISLLLALVLVLALAPVPSASAADKLAAPRELRWSSDYTVSWKTVPGAAYYDVKLVYFAGSGSENYVTHVGVESTHKQLPSGTFEYSDTMLYRVEVVARGNGFENSDPAVSETVSGKAIINHYRSPEIQQTNESFYMQVNIQVEHACVINLAQYANGGATPSVTRVDYISGLPNGVSWSWTPGRTPVIAGKPTKSGVHRVRFYVELSNGQKLYHTVYLSVLTEPVDVSDQFTAYLLQDCEFNSTLSGEGKAWSGYTFLYGTLPPGITAGFNEAAGLYFSGTPTERGSFYAAYQLIRADAKAFNYTAFFDIVPEEGPGAVMRQSAFLGKSCSFSLDTGATAPFLSGNLTDGLLPDGLSWSFSADGGITVSGTPQETGVFTSIFELITTDGIRSETLLRLNVVPDGFDPDVYELDLTTGRNWTYTWTYEEKIRSTLDAAAEVGLLTRHTGSDGTTYDLDFDGNDDVGVHPGQEEDVLIFYLTENCSLPYNYSLFLTDAAYEWLESEGILDYSNGIRFLLEPVREFEVLDLSESGSLQLSDPLRIRAVITSLRAAQQAGQINMIMGENQSDYYLDLDLDAFADLRMETIYTDKEILSFQVLSSSSLKQDVTLKLSSLAIELIDPMATGFCRKILFRLPDTVRNPFKDVSPSKYYFTPILWAYETEPQITNGTDDTHFSPDKPCTRAQIVAFLWRAKGCPEPKASSCPFKDVKSSAYYYKAVLWAVEEGITKGKDETHFAPTAECSRAEVVTFLWRAEGSPTPSAETTPFTDIKEGYYYKAVLWAVENRIASGVSDTSFAPKRSCSRAQIATFLYRTYFSYNILGSKDLLAYVDGVFQVEDRGLVITVQIENGTIFRGDSIRVTGYDPDAKKPVSQLVTVHAITYLGRELYSAGPGKNVGLVLTVPENSSIREGDAVLSPDSRMIPVEKNVFGLVQMRSGADPNFTLREGMKPFFRYYGNRYNTFTVLTTPGGLITQGQLRDNVQLTDFQNPMVYYVGQQLTIFKGGTSCGDYWITRIGP